MSFQHKPIIATKKIICYILASMILNNYSSRRNIQSMSFIYVIKVRSRHNRNIEIIYMAMDISRLIPCSLILPLHSIY